MGGGKLCYLCDRRPSKQDQISFHKFPKDPEIREKWINACDLSPTDDVSGILICTLHFTSDDLVTRNSNSFLLKNGAIPSVNIPINISEYIQQKSCHDIESENAIPNHIIKHESCQDIQIENDSPNHITHESWQDIQPENDIPTKHIKQESCQDIENNVPHCLKHESSKDLENYTAHDIKQETCENINFESYFIKQENTEDIENDHLLYPNVNSDISRTSTDSEQENTAVCTQCTGLGVKEILCDEKAEDSVIEELQSFLTDIDGKSPFSDDEDDELIDSPQLSDSNHGANTCDDEHNAKRLCTEPRYISEIRISDLVNPETASRTVNLIKRTLEKKNKQIEDLQDINRKLHERAESLKETIVNLKTKT